MPKNNPHERPLENYLTVFSEEDPFKDLTDEQRDEVILQIAQEGKIHFEKSFEKLITSLLPSIPPIHLLSHLAFYDQIVIPSMQMSLSAAADRDATSPLEQAHLELLQALLLRIEPDEFPDSSPINYPQIIEEIRAEVRSLYATWSFSRLNHEG